MHIVVRLEAGGQAGHVLHVRRPHLTIAVRGAEILRLSTIWSEWLLHRLLEEEVGSCAEA